MDNTADEEGFMKEGLAQLICIKCDRTAMHRMTEQGFQTKCDSCGTQELYEVAYLEAAKEIASCELFRGIGTGSRKGFVRAKKFRASYRWKLVSEAA